MADSHGRMYGMMPQQFGGPMRNAFGLGHAPPGPPMHYQGGPAWFGTGNAHPRGPARPRKRAAKFGPGDSQPAQPAPSLQALRAENRSKARKHFHRSGAPAHGTGPSPPTWSVPPAPGHATKILYTTPGRNISPGLAHFVTPAASFASTEKGYWRNGLGANIDPQAAEIGAAAGIDMFGTNAGLITGGDDDSQDEDPYGFELHVDEHQAEPGDLPADVRQKLEEQSAYICQLEDTNLKLQERVFLLEQQLQRQAKRGRSSQEEGAPSSGSAGHAHIDADADGGGQSESHGSPLPHQSTCDMLHAASSAHDEQPCMLGEPQGCMTVPEDKFAEPLHTSHSAAAPSAALVAPFDALPSHSALSLHAHQHANQPDAPVNAAPPSPAVAICTS